MMKYLNATIVILALLCLGMFTWTAANLLIFPYGVNYGEAPLVDQARRVLDGESIYSNNLDEPPYVISNYPPFYIWTMAGVTRLTGMPLLQSGRLVSFIASLSSGLILGLLAREISAKASAGLLAAGLFLGNPYLMIWGGLGRVDMLAIMLSLLGVWLVYRGGNKWLQIGVAGICLAAAVYTRQTTLLAGPLACLIYLWRQQPRRALQLAAWVGGIGLASFILLNSLSKGGFFTNIVTANVNRYQFSRLVSLGSQQLLILPVILVLGLGKTAQALARGVRRTTSPSPSRVFTLTGLPFYTLGAFVVAMLAGKVGSDVNYFIELSAACSLWTAVTVTQHISTTQIAPRLVRMALTLQMVFMLAGGIFVWQDVYASTTQQMGIYQQLEGQVQVAAQQGPVLSDDYLHLVLLAGQPIYYQPFEYGQLYQAGLWDPSRLAAEIDQQRFPLILIGGNTIEKDCCWPPQLIQAIWNSYDLTYEEEWVTCTPKNR